MENLVSNSILNSIQRSIGSQWRFARTGTSNPALRTPHYYGQFALSLGKESSHIFSKFNQVKY